MVLEMYTNLLNGDIMHSQLSCHLVPIGPINHLGDLSHVDYLADKSKFKRG